MAKEQEHDDADVESGNDADERRIKEVKEKVREAREKPDDDDEEAVVESDDDEDDETDSEPTRREKRQNRFKEMQERMERAERASQQYAAQQQQMLQQLMQQNQPREPAVDHRQELDKAYEENELKLIALRSRYSQRAHQYNAAGHEMPREEMREFISEQRELELKKQEAIGTFYARQNNFQGPDPRKQAADMEMAVVRASNADVFANAAAQMHVNYAYHRMIKTEGKPDSIDTLNAAVVEARKVILKKGAEKPTQNAKAKFTGSASNSAGAAPSREGAPVIKVGPEGRKMADAAFPHIKDEKKRYELWGKQMYASSKQAKKQA